MNEKRKNFIADLFAAYGVFSDTLDNFNEETHEELAGKKDDKDFARITMMIFLLKKERGKMNGYIEVILKTYMDQIRDNIQEKKAGGDSNKGSE